MNVVTPFLIGRIKLLVKEEKFFLLKSSMLKKDKTFSFYMKTKFDLHQITYPCIPDRGCLQSKYLFVIGNVETLWQDLSIKFITNISPSYFYMDLCNKIILKTLIIVLSF